MAGKITEMITPYNNDYYQQYGARLLFDIRTSSSRDILNHYNEFGVVAITSILSPIEIYNTVIEIEELIKKNSNQHFSFYEPSTYNTVDNYVSKNYGVIGKTALFSNYIMKNRLHPNVRKAYSIVYDYPEEELTPCYDRASWMRPTIGTNGEDWRMYETPTNIHLDISPTGYFTKNYDITVKQFLSTLNYQDAGDFIAENNAKHFTMGRHVQGVLNLFNNDEEDGGFHCYPTGHNILKDWYEQVKTRLPLPEPNGKYVFNEKQPTDKLFFNTERIPCPAGTLILFDATLPHGTKSNKSNKNRLIQFIRYIPKNTFEPKNFKNRCNAIMKNCNEIDKENKNSKLRFIPTDEELKLIGF